jgi:hypothetical protein
MEKKIGVVGSGGNSGKSLLAALFAMTASFNRYANPIHSSKFEGAKIIPSIRNPKDPIKKAAIERRRKATKLSKLSKAKRRAVYQYNLRHPLSKMYV